MATQTKTGGSGDCTLLNALWGMMWDPTSEFYLPKVINNGLKDPTWGIDIPPFATINIGDLPEITMFKEPVLGYMKLTLSSTTLQGLGSVTKGALTCNDTNPQQTTLTLSLPFGQLEFTGNYTVDAGGGIGGCAIAAGAAILGGSAFGAESIVRFLAASSGDDPVDQHIQESLWYREPLSNSQNGQDLVGAYYINNPAILDLVNEPNSALAQAMKAANVKETANQVNAATNYYYQQKQGAHVSDDAAPTIGTQDQYASGGLPSIYALAMARQKVNSGRDPDGRYKRLADHIVHFTAGIGSYQQKYPGLQPVGTDNGVINRVAAFPLEEVTGFAQKRGPVPVIDLENPEQIVEYLTPGEINLQEIRSAYQAHYGSRFKAADSSGVDGTFVDTGLPVTLNVSANITTPPAGITCTITALSADIGALHITLSQSKGWWPGLYDKVTNWIANSFMTGMIKSKLNDQLGSDEMKKNLSDLITGGLRKLSA